MLPNNAIQRSAHATRCEKIDKKDGGMHKTYVLYQNVSVTHNSSIFFFGGAPPGRAVSLVRRCSRLNAVGRPTRGHGYNVKRSVHIAYN